MLQSDRLPVPDVVFVDKVLGGDVLEQVYEAVVDLKIISKVLHILLYLLKFVAEKQITL